jgi:hypothetical protein
VYIRQVVWKEPIGANADIFYRRSIDGGANFEPVVNLSNNSGASFPAVSASGNNVYVVWTDNTPGNNEILYRKSIDGGVNFDIIKSNLSANSGSSSGAKIAVS